MEQLKRPALIFAFLTACLCAFAEKPEAEKRQSPGTSILPIQNGFVKNDLLGYLYMFSTPDSTIGIGDVMGARSNFQLLKEELPNLGMDHRYHWLRLSIRNIGGKPQSLVYNLHFVEVSRLAFYIVSSDNKINYQENLSRETPVSKRPVLSRYFAFPITIAPGDQLTIYCQIQRDHGALLAPVSLFAKQSFFDHIFMADMLLYFTLGIFVVASFLTLILFLVSRRRLLLYYSGYSLFYGLSITNLEGISFRSFNIHIPFLDENTNVVFICVIAFFMVLFSIDFLQIDVYAPKWLTRAARALVVLALASTIFALLWPFSDRHVSLASLIGLVTMIMVTLMIIYGIIHRKFEAILYLVAITPFFFMSLWFAASVFGVPRTWLFFRLSHYSSLFEIVILGVGIGYKLLSDRDRYLLKLNQLQKDFTSSILQTQDLERQRIAADLHDDLGGTLATIKRSISDLRAEATAPETREKFDNLEPLILKSSEDLRRISHNLMPPEFDRIGLSNSVAQLVSALPMAPTRFQYLCAGQEKRLEREIELNAYRIVSELIQNILKHANAKQAAIQLVYFDHSLQILVEDNGLGNKNKTTEPHSMGLGLKNCMLRANYIGAKLTREISEGGSIIVLDIPYR